MGEHPIGYKLTWDSLIFHSVEGYHFTELPLEELPVKGETLAIYDGISNYGKAEVPNLGIDMNVRGFHAFKHPLDALWYAMGFNCAKVLLEGDIIKHSDKYCASRMTNVSGYADVREALQLWALDCADQVLPIWVHNNRLRDALLSARLYLDGGMKLEEIKKVWKEVHQMWWELDTDSDRRCVHSVEAAIKCIWESPQHMNTAGGAAAYAIFEYANKNAGTSWTPDYAGACLLYEKERKRQTDLLVKLIDNQLEEI